MPIMNRSSLAPELPCPDGTSLLDDRSRSPGIPVVVATSLLLLLRFGAAAALVVPAVLHASAGAATAQALDSSDFTNEPLDDFEDDDAEVQPDDVNGGAGSADADRDREEEDRESSGRGSGLDSIGDIGAGADAEDDPDRDSDDTDGDGIPDDEDPKRGK
jgi:hypothetical protein